MGLRGCSGAAMLSQLEVPLGESLEVSEESILRTGSSGEGREDVDIASRHQGVYVSIGLPWYRLICACRLAVVTKVLQGRLRRDDV